MNNDLNNNKSLFDETILNDPDDDDSDQHIKTKIIKCKTNNQQIQPNSYNILTSNGSTTQRSNDNPTEHTSLKLHIRVCSPSATDTPTSIHDSTEHHQLPTKIISRKFFNSNELTHSKQQQQQQPRRFTSTRRTSLIETDSPSIYDLPKTQRTTTISDENNLKKVNDNKRKFTHESQEKKRSKLPTNRTSKQPAAVQTRSSTRLKQKQTPTSSKRTKRQPSTELLTSQTSTDDLPVGEYQNRLSLPTKRLENAACQTTDDIIEIFHQSNQTDRLIKSDKSTYTDFLDQPLCENSTQTTRKDEQETQTTDLNCPHDSQVYFYQLKDNQTQCEEFSDEYSSSPLPTSVSPAQFFDQQQTLSSPYMDFSLTNNNHDRLQIFQNLIHTEEHPNGGASLIRTYYNEFLHLSNENASLFVNYFFNLVYGEMNQRAKYSIGVLHDGARYLPDLVDYFSLTYPKMIVKTSNLLNSKEVLTTTMGEYRNHLVQTYCNGTFRYGPLLSISLVGKVTGKEECGDYFPTFIDKLEENPFLQCVMPWGPYSSVQMKTRTDSDDGPILWVRPGEQYVPTGEHKSCHPKKRLANELRNLTFTGRGSEPREVLVEDRTKPHSDHCDADGIETTAAVGILKAVHCGTP